MLRRFFHRNPTSSPSRLQLHGAVQRWLVLHQGDNPSTDYYIRPRLQQFGLPVIYKKLDASTPQPADLSPGTGVVIVRYLNDKWVRALHVHRAHLPKIVYFMDDDLLHPQSWKGLPRPYVKKLNKYCRAHTADIDHLATDFWFSTQALRDRYPERRAKLVHPQTLTEDRGNPAIQTGVRQSPVLVFYHGSGAHQSEITWLHPIIAKVLARCPNVHFELIGDHDVNKLYRGLPRTRIIHPLDWANYRAHCRLLDGHIGLAPLLPSTFNAGRAHVKAFDIARCRAIGLYAASGPYQEVIRHNENGLLLDNNPENWIEALSSLADNPDRLNVLRVASSLLLHPDTRPAHARQADPDVHHADHAYS